MTYKMTPAEFVAKADWEGGIIEAILGYGLNEEDLDDSDPDLKTAVQAFRLAASPPLDRLLKLADEARERQGSEDLD